MTPKDPSPNEVEHAAMLEQADQAVFRHRLFKLHSFNKLYNTINATVVTPVLCC